MNNRKSKTAKAIGNLKPSTILSDKEGLRPMRRIATEAAFERGFAAARSAAVQLVQEQFDRELAAMRREISLELRVQQLPHLNNL